MSIISHKQAHLNQSNFLKDFLYGGIAGIISKTVVAPIQRVKLLMQTQTQNTRLTKKYNGITDCFIRCVKQQGYLSLWRGNWVNVVRYFPTQALSFSIKDLLNSYCNFNSQTKQERLHFLLIKIMNGGLAGSFTTIIVHPLDFARTRIGVDLGKSLQERQFRGLKDCLTKTYKSDGIVGVYRGLVVSIPSIFIYRGLYFGIYDTGKQLLLTSQDGKEASIAQKFFLAQFSVVFSQFLAYPGDTVKRKIMMQSLKKEKQYNGAIDCFKKIYQRQGLAGLWRGSWSNVMRSVGSSLCLVLYDEFRKVQIKSH